MQERVGRQVLMSGVKDRSSLTGTKKNQEDLSVDQRLRNVFVPSLRSAELDWLADRTHL